MIQAQNASFFIEISCKLAPHVATPQDEFKGSVTTVTVTLTDPNPLALSTLVYWLSGNTTPLAKNKAHDL